MYKITLDTPISPSEFTTRPDLAPKLLAYKSLSPNFLQSKLIIGYYENLTYKYNEKILLETSPAVLK